MLGRMMGLFGGKAAKEGLVDTVAAPSLERARRNAYYLLFRE
jgi:hypothetical protein